MESKGLGKNEKNAKTNANRISISELVAQWGPPPTRGTDMHRQSENVGICQNLSENVGICRKMSKFRFGASNGGYLQWQDTGKSV